MRNIFKGKNLDMVECPKCKNTDTEFEYITSKRVYDNLYHQPFANVFDPNKNRDGFKHTCHTCKYAWLTDLDHKTVQAEWFLRQSSSNITIGFIIGYEKKGYSNVITPLRVSGRGSFSTEGHHQVAIFNDMGDAQDIIRKLQMVDGEKMYILPVCSAMTGV